MRIGVNAVPLRPSGGGARFVFTGLLDSLLRQDSANQYVIFCHPVALGLVRAVLEKLPAPQARIIEASDETEVYPHRGEFDLYFAPLNNLRPRLNDIPSVAILHDIQEQYFPEYFSKSDLLGRQEDYPEICRSATRIVAISEFCKQTFIDKFGIDPGKIAVIHNGPQHDLVDRRDDGRWLREALPREFFFYPANTYRHKNHKLLLEAIARLRQDGGDPPHMVFSGHELPASYPLRREIARMGLSDLCRLYNDLSADEMRHLYRRAAALVMPTMFEGFGMPAVEAMACSCPVVCTDIPALREVAGEAALYTPPGDLPALCAALRGVREDAASRQRMIARGRELAGRFSWDVSARKYLALFDEARTAFAQAATRPKIGLIIHLTRGGQRLRQTLDSLAGNDVSAHAVVRGDAIEPAAAALLAERGIALHHLPVDTPFDFSILAAHAAERTLDLVGEISEGHRLTNTASASLAWAWNTMPGKVVYLGEVFNQLSAQRWDVSRLRLTGDGLWKLEGFLYPEMMFICPARLAAWPGGAELVNAAGGTWRWELLREARAQDKLALPRRNLAECEQDAISLATRRHALQQGMAAYYTCADDKRAKVRLLRRFEPIARAMCRLLPLSIQHMGTRLWYKLAR